MKAFLHALEDANVKTVFGIPGKRILDVYDLLLDSDITNILTRHEQGAVHACDGYARVSGSPGTCIATAGPGALNLTMGIVNANKDNVPVVAITGLDDISTNLFRDITKKSIVLENDVYETVLSFYELSMKDCPGPVHLAVSEDVLKKKEETKRRKFFIARREPNRNLVRKLADMIENSNNPLILAGSGIIWSNAYKDLIKLAESLSIPISTSMMARGAIPEDHPLSLGVMGKRGDKKANEMLKETDLLIVMGCSASPLTVDPDLIDAKIVRIDVKKNSFRLPTDLEIIGDAKLVLQELSKYDMNKKRGKKKDKKGFEEFKGFTSKTICKTIYEILGKKGITVYDIGSFTVWGCMLSKVYKPRSFIVPGNFTPMGFSIPASIGAQIAMPDELVVSIVGDGGFMMSSSELATIEQYDIPVKIILINNSSLGLIEQFQERIYGRTTAIDLKNPDFLKLTNSYGIDGERVEDIPSLNETLKEAIKIREPFLIECIVEEEEEIPDLI